MVSGFLPSTRPRAADVASCALGPAGGTVAHRKAALWCGQLDSIYLCSRLSYASTLLFWKQLHSAVSPGQEPGGGCGPLAVCGLVMGGFIVASFGWHFIPSSLCLLTEFVFPGFSALLMSGWRCRETPLGTPSSCALQGIRWLHSTCR